MYFCVAILIICCLGAGFARITKAPRNVVALVRTTATLECCNGVNNNSLQWRRVSLDTVDSSDIYLGKSLGFVDNFGEGRFKISDGNTSGCYNLIISDIQLDDAGNYTCADESDLEQHSASADLTILESFTCDEVFPNKEVYMGINAFHLDPDMIQLMCSIKYIGKFIPEMQWKWQKSSKVSNLKASVTNLNATSTSVATSSSIVTFVAAKQFDRNQITCFVQSPGDEDLSRNTVNWPSKLYRVNYAIFHSKEVFNCNAEELNLECNPPCSISSVGDGKGSYFCEISFQSETSSKRRVPIRAVVLAHFWTTAEVATIIAVMGVAAVLLSFVVGILIYRLRKIQGNQKLSYKLLHLLVKGLCDVCKSKFLHREEFREILEAVARSESSNSEHRQDGVPEENQLL